MASRLLVTRRGSLNALQSSKWLRSSVHCYASESLSVCSLSSATENEHEVNSGADPASLPTFPAKPSYNLSNLSCLYLELSLRPLNRDSSTWNLLAGKGFFSASPYLSLSCPWNGLAGDCKTLSVAPPLPRQTVRLFYAHSIRALAEAQHQHVQRRFASNEATATKVKQSSLESNPSNNATSSAETRLVSQQPDSSKKKGDSNGLTTSTEKVEKPSEALVTKGSRSIPQQVQDTIVAASKAIVSFLIKLPGWTFYYITHPTELRKALNNLWEAIKHEANHYWMGTKLLYADVQTAGKLLRRTLNGSSLTRRERKQLLRTVSDLFRLVPFSMFILIPFMEFALPFALRLFPNMLPSTFQDSLKAEENMKRELQSRIAMAQFFQETLQEMAKEKKKIATSRREHADEAAETEGVSKFEKQERSAAAMLEFLEKARKGEFLPADIIIQFASHFHDDLTLDNMPRMQLINMCRYMNIPPYGSDNFLRFQLRHKIRSLVDDDQRILWEGIDSLTKMELREACQERGMRSTGLSKDAYKSALQQWLDLSVNKHVPISLLIMSRSFFLREEMTARGPPEESNSQAVAGLADAISGLDQDIVNEVVLEVATSEEKKSDPAIRKIKLEVLEAQNERILEEQLEREAASKKKEKELQKEETPEVEVKAKSADDVQAPPAAGMEDISADDSASVAKETEKTETKKTETKESEEDYLSTEEMDALSQLISKNPVNREREELERIKAAIADRKKEDVDIEKIKATMMSENTEDSSLAWGDGEKVYSSSAMERVSGKIYVKPEPLTQEEVEQAAKEVISKMDAASSAEADASTTTQPDDASAIVAAEAETHEVDHRLDRTIESLKARVSQMVDKIESQLESVEEKIGDKLHFLDKDGDGMLTLSEMADALQSVLKRKISHEEAMAIADLMDENKDGVFTVDEFKKWIETNKIVQLLKTGKDGDLDRLLEKHLHHSADEEEQQKET